MSLVMDESREARRYEYSRWVEAFKAREIGGDRGCGKDDEGAEKGCCVPKLRPTHYVTLQRLHED